MKKSVLVGMSGGIDSSMSAYMLKEQGYEVSGVYMKLHNLTDGYHEKNIESGRRIANFLDIDYHILDLSEEFANEVYNYFIDEYKNGNTPNPCVKCNKSIKFGRMFEFAQSLGIEYLATGHYVKTDGTFLYEADDLTKDQSYFLAQIKQEVLKHLVFPMAGYEKENIIKMAKTMPAFEHLVDKKESQEICFVDTVYTDILKKYYKIDTQGDVLNTQGDVVGHHKGYMHYTVGKRRGFYVHGAHEPHYINKIDPQNNTITVSNKDGLAIKEVILEELNLYIQEKKFQCYVKLRYRTQKVACDVTIENDIAYVKLHENVYGVAKGQVGVFYQDNKVLGSGFINATSFENS